MFKSGDTFNYSYNYISFYLKGFSVFSMDFDCKLRSIVTLLKFQKVQDFMDHFHEYCEKYGLSSSSINRSAISTV